MKAQISKFMKDLQDSNSNLNVLELYSDLTKLKESTFFFDRLNTNKFCKAFIELHINYNSNFTTIERYFRQLKAEERLKIALNKDIPTNNPF